MSEKEKKEEKKEDAGMLIVPIENLRDAEWRISDLYNKISILETMVNKYIVPLPSGDGVIDIEFLYKNLVELRESIFGFKSWSREFEQAYNNRFVDIETVIGLNSKEQVKRTIPLIKQLNELKTKVDGMSNGCSLAQQNLGELNELKDKDQVLLKHLQDHFDIADADRDDITQINLWKGKIVLLMEALKTQRPPMKDCPHIYTSEHPFWECGKCGHREVYIIRKRNDGQITNSETADIEK